MSFTWGDEINQIASCWFQRVCLLKDGVTILRDQIFPSRWLAGVNSRQSTVKHDGRSNKANNNNPIQQLHLSRLHKQTRLIIHHGMSHTHAWSYTNLSVRSQQRWYVFCFWSGIAPTTSGTPAASVVCPFFEVYVSPPTFQRGYETYRSSCRLIPLEKS
jgi:hypothetical protein